MSLNCTGDDGFTCGFAFDVSVPPHQFYEALKKEVDLIHPPPDDFIVFSLDYVKLMEWYVIIFGILIFFSPDKLLHYRPIFSKFGV